MAVVGKKSSSERQILSRPYGRSGNLKLRSGSRIAVIGSGPAGSLFGYFLLTMAQRVNLDLQVDIYERRNFSKPGPAGCNHCGGIISESLVQILAAEGINLPDTVVQRGIDSYVLHMDEGSVRIGTPLDEKRIAAIHRGAGPRDLKDVKWGSFDAYLQNLAKDEGAQLINGHVDDVTWENDRPQIKTRGGLPNEYDLLAVALGVNSPTLKQFQDKGLNYQLPQTTKTYICEYYLGKEKIAEYLGSSMHVFLLNVPRLEFAAVIPKGDYVTVCLLGDKIDRPLIQTFLDSIEVKQCFPPDWRADKNSCQCSPHINFGGAVQPFADRIVFIGDCGVTRLYKDGIGAAYRTAKAAATTAIFEGISAEDFRRHYWPTCQAISTDNKLGKVIFAVTRLIQKLRYARLGILRMVYNEQHKEGSRRRMSLVLWDVFTGSAPYRDVFLRTLNPLFQSSFLWHKIVAIWSLIRGKQFEEVTSKKVATEIGSLGKKYGDGEIIVRQGEAGNCMFVIQAGKVDVLANKEGQEVHLAELGEGDFFGEMALFERELRSATVRAKGEVRVLTVDKRTFLRRIQEDPSMAFRIAEKMSHRIRELNNELVRIKTVV